MGNKNAWILVYRDLFESPLWKDEPFTTGQAWIDLIGMANYADTQRFYKGSYRVVGRGQILTTIRYLAERWHWSPKKTLQTLRAFEEANMITRETNNRETLLTVENYNKFQLRGNTEETRNPKKIKKNPQKRANERNGFNLEISSKTPIVGNTESATGVSTDDSTDDSQSKESKEIKELNKYIYTTSHGDIVSITIPLRDGIYEITVDDMDTYTQAYPHLDVKQELIKAAVWSRDNPSKRKTRNGVKRFLNAWLNRAKPETKSIDWDAIVEEMENDRKRNDFNF